MPETLGTITPVDSYCAEVRLKDHGLKSIEIVDNGTGIAPEDYDHVGKFEQLFMIECLSFTGFQLGSTIRPSSLLSMN